MNPSPCPQARPSRPRGGAAVVIHQRQGVSRGPAARGRPAIKAFRLRKFDGTEYDIAQTREGITCDCPDFTFNRDGIDPEGCKHVKALVACGLIDPAQDVARGARRPPGPRPRPAALAPRFGPEAAAHGPTTSDFAPNPPLSP